MNPVIASDKLKRLNVWGDDEKPLIDFTYKAAWEKALGQVKNLKATIEALDKMERKFP